MKLDLIAISVHYLDLSLAFYRTYFFWEEIKRIEKNEYTIIFGKTSFGLVELFYCKNHTIGQHSDTLWEELSITGIKHVGLSVDEEEFDFLYQQFISDNVPIFQKPTSGSLVKKYFYIKDPNGVSIEFLVN